MSAFQDFGPLTERRKAERQQNRRKRLMIIGASVAVLSIIVVIGVVAVVHHSGGDDSDSRSSKGSNAKKQTQSVSKSVQMLCSNTDYKKTCESSLSKASNSSTSAKELVKVAVNVIVDEVNKAFDRPQLFKSHEKLMKGAIEICKERLNSSKHDLFRTLDHLHVDDVEELLARRRALKSWLSAVMANTETCIDAFPDGELKKKMREGMKTAKEMTSNALAIVQEAASILSALKIPGFSGRALVEEEPYFHDDGFPTWVSEGDRRLLKEQANMRYTANVTVAEDGSGDFKTISEALAAIPKKRDTSQRYYIYVKAGLYAEYVIVEGWMTNVTMYGDGSRKTIVTGNKNRKDGVETFVTATFIVNADSFIAEGMCFQNTAGPEKEQAVALRVSGDVCIFANCRIEAYQDTLYAHSKRQFYRGCVITGTIDFIFGDSAAIIQNSVITVRKPAPNQQNIVTAQGRTDRREDTGLVLQKCRFTAEPGAEAFENYLARPWKFKSRTVFLENEIGSFIHPDGYMKWPSNPEYSDTCSYAEFGNTGPGADISKRVKWPGIKTFTKADAAKYTANVFLDAGDWVKKQGVPVQLGFYQH